MSIARRPPGSSVGGQFSPTNREYREPRIRQEGRHHLTRARAVLGVGATSREVREKAAEFRELESRLQAWDPEGFRGEAFDAGRSCEARAAMVRQDVEEAVSADLLPPEVTYDVQVDGDVVRVTVRGLPDERALMLHMDYDSQTPVMVPTVEADDIERVLMGVCGRYSKLSGDRWDAPFAVRFESDRDRALARFQAEGTPEAQAALNEVDARISTEALWAEWNRQMPRDYDD